MTPDPAIIQLKPINPADPNELERTELLREIIRVQDELIGAHLEVRRLSLLTEKLKNRARALGAKI